MITSASLGCYVEDGMEEEEFGCLKKKKDTGTSLYFHLLPLRKNHE